MPFPLDAKAYWNFDGNLADSIDSHPFTITAGAPTFVPGHINQAVHTNGINDYCTVAYTSDFALGTGQAWTLTGWVNLDTASLNPSNGPIFLSKGKTGGAQPLSWLLEARGGNPGFYVLSVIFNTDDDVSFIGDFADNAGHKVQLSPGTWHNFAIGVDNGGNPWFKLDCFNKASWVPGHFWTFQTTDPIILGCAIDGGSNLPGSFFPGSVDEVRYWNRALTDQELLEICTDTIPNPNPPTPPTPPIPVTPIIPIIAPPDFTPLPFVPLPGLPPKGVVAVNAIGAVPTTYWLHGELNQIALLDTRNGLPSDLCYLRRTFTGREANHRSMKKRVRRIRVYGEGQFNAVPNAGYLFVTSDVAQTEVYVYSVGSTEFTTGELWRQDTLQQTGRVFTVTFVGQGAGLVVTEIELEYMIIG